VSTLLNPGTTPVTYTDDARIIEAGTRLYDVELDDTGRAAVARGDLVEETEENGAEGNDTADTSAPEAAPAPDAPAESTDKPTAQG
jgi:hypothetical protein